jgi:translation initiation factor 2A
MPAKTVIFDARVKIINDFGTNPRNFLSYNPQGRLLCIAGFGNLAGQVDVWDRQTLKKVTTIDAPNTVHCEWSPDGRYLLCATLSPRLRVDNGIKVYHFTGGLMHADSIEELYQVSTICSISHQSKTDVSFNFRRHPGDRRTLASGL